MQTSSVLLPKEATQNTIEPKFMRFIQSKFNLMLLCMNYNHSTQLKSIKENWILYEKTGQKIRIRNTKRLSKSHNISQTLRAAVKFYGSLFFNK